MSLDEALKSFNVNRQAYHGGAFVGNHVHRALKVHQHEFFNILYVYLFLKESNITVLCSAPEKTAQQLSVALVSEANNIRQKYTVGFNLYSQCYHLYTKTSITSEEVHQLGKYNV